MVVLSVAKYFPDRLYGFLRSVDGSDVYFHVGDFEGKPWADPPPITGERVEVYFGPTEPLEDSHKAPKAVRVRRLDAPRCVSGVVVSFEEVKGWGFIKGSDGTDYYLHRSEVLLGRLPVKGQRVEFWAGFKNTRPRACYVSIEQ